MQKTSFIFPDYESLWQFKNETQAVNVAVTPKKNQISGLFEQNEVEMAVNKFKAVTVPKIESSVTTQKTSRFKSNSINYLMSVRSIRKIVASMQMLKIF